MTAPRLYGPAGKCGVNMGAMGHPGEHAADACDQPATVTVEFGCVHEHVFRERKCPAHAAALAAGTAPFICSACWEGRGGIPRHECRLLARVVPQGAVGGRR